MPRIWVLETTAYKFHTQELRTAPGGGNGFTGRPQGIRKATMLHMAASLLLPYPMATPHCSKIDLIGLYAPGSRNVKGKKRERAGRTRSFFLPTGQNHLNATGKL